MFNLMTIIPIIMVAVLGLIGNIVYFEYRFRKESEKEIIKERLIKLLLPLYIILQTDELDFISYLKYDLDPYEHISEKPERLFNPIKKVLDKNLYLADDELQKHSLLLLDWMYGENVHHRFQEVHCGELKQDKVFTDFRDVVYKKFDEQKRKYID